ncbi:hypothetical protein HR12_10605 [Microbacterium sp. SUBG005]|nr:hypothetical protein HR12_10605 [Microbacterium sp. SUBG005]
MARRTERLFARTLLIAVLSGSLMMLAACTTSKEATMSPSEARDTLIRTIQDTAAQLEVQGWNRDGAAEVGNCGAQRGERVNYTYGYGAPAPDSDHAADARTVADYWRSIGMQVRVVDTPVHVVYGTGGPTEGLSFSTAPGNYYIAGESLCVPGDVDEIRKQDNG